MDGDTEKRSVHASGFIPDPESHPTAGGSFVNEGGAIRPLTEKEEKAAAEARSALTPSDMKRFDAEHAAKLAARAAESSEAGTDGETSKRRGKGRGE